MMMNKAMLLPCVSRQVRLCFKSCETGESILICVETGEVQRRVFFLETIGFM